MGKPATFRYINMEGKDLSPEEIGENCDKALDIALGVRSICELTLANLNGGGVDCDRDALFRVIHAAMEKAIEIGTHLYYERDSAQEGEA